MEHADIYETNDLQKAYAHVRFIQAVGGTVLGVEKAEDEYTVRAVVPESISTTDHE